MEPHGLDAPAPARAAPDDQPRSVCLVGLIAGGHSGVPRYAAKLVGACDRVSGSYPNLQVSLLTTRAAAEAIEPRSLRVRTVGGGRRFVNAGPGRLLLEHLAVRTSRDDLLHFFDLTGPMLAPGRPFVTTIHDMTALGFRTFKNAYKRRLYPWAIGRAAAAVAVSSFAKEEAVRQLGADPAKIHVVHSGPGLSPESAPVVPRSPAPAPYLLYVGNLAANKNLPMLIRAFHESNAPIRLVLAGRPREGAEDVRLAVGAGRRADRIDLLDSPSDAVVDGLYRSALALVLPSTYEGFGFTPLEAMSRGCPVLASDIPALRETAGAGALLLPPLDASAWTEAIDRIAGDPELRKKLQAAGAATVAGYSWDATARGILDMLGSISLR